MYETLTNRLSGLPDDTVLYPGHAYGGEHAPMGVVRKTKQLLADPGPRHLATPHELVSESAVTPTRGAGCVVPADAPIPRGQRETRYTVGNTCRRSVDP